VRGSYCSGRALTRDGLSGIRRVSDLIPGPAGCLRSQSSSRKRPVGKTVAVSNTSRAGLAVAGLSLGTSLNPLNSSMIAVALVVLREDFRLDVARSPGL
jgi:hypothetical protein